MSALALESAVRYLSLWLPSLWPPRSSSARRTLRRALVMLVFLPAFGLLQLTHWLGFAVDAILFRGYRKVVVREPLFVTGVPRSGTTMLHRTLCDDEQYTTMTTWECLFAPSVAERKLWRGLAAADRLVGAPLARLLAWLEKRALSGLDEVHGVRLAEAEEDYFVLMPLLRCFILIVPFPYAPWVWEMGRFDSAVAPEQRRRIMRFYHDCIRRHLYVHGTDKRYLCKNASFPPLLASLHNEFPDARFVYCLRDPREVVPSQLSSLRDGMEFFGNDPYDERFRDRLLGQLAHYYDRLINSPVPDGQYVRMPMDRLKNDIHEAVRDIYRRLSLPLSEQFDAVLRLRADAARAYRSGHRYSLAEFGLDDSRLRREFAHAFAALETETGGAHGAVREGQ